MKPAIRPRLLAVAVVTSFLLVTGSLAGGAPALADAGDAAFTATPMPTLNAPVVNKRDVASPGTWVPTPDSLSFQWFENGIAIDGTGSESPLFGPDDQGAQITVAVTATKAGYASQTETSAPVTVLGAITATSVAIDGVPKPGETLTADGSFDPSDSTVSYAWMDQNGWIPGATSQTYVPTEAEAGHNISVDFRVSHDGYQATSFGRWVQITYATFQPPLNILTGDVHIGSTVQAPQESSWFPQPTTLTYQWMRGSADIPGATGPSHIVTNGDIGYVLHVRETGSRAGYPDATWTSPPTTEVLADFDQITTPVIVGTPEVGVPLTVKEAPWTPAATNWGTEWYVNGVATGDGGNLIPSAGDIGATITAEVYGWSGTRAVDISPLSAPTAPVRANTYKLGAVTIGIVDLNRTVGATFTKPSASATLSYQWMINGSAIAGATKSTYLPEGSNWHKNLSVRITVSGSGYTTSVGVS
ncbi:MAG: hypothetical protein QOH44_603, partial [Actinomycetota bacterium]|nr:hypothetical protein [Actinomycetota bacterium]